MAELRTSDSRQIEEYALRVMNLARDSIVVRFRFFDAALSRYAFVSSPGLGGYEADGEHLYYDPAVLLLDYRDEQAFPLRLLLHVLFHGIFLHSYRTEKRQEAYWNIACDIAVENIVLGLELPEGAMLRDGEERIILTRLGKWVPSLTADAIYREFMVGGISADSQAKYAALFAFDRHLPRERVTERQMLLTKKDWERIAERVKAELRSFSKEVTGSAGILMNLKESTKKRYDYDEILRRFAVMNEEIKVSPDEFDYIYYTYGLSHYDNMPLIEPLEYAEENKIREFVIAVDTSASVSGKTVTDFLTRTYDILTASAAFSEEMHVRILQCDARITADLKVTSREQLRDAAEHFAVKGFGATDFRPVFAYVDDLVAAGEFRNLKGLIYFTDGYGIYPDSAPKYDTMFVFNSDDEYRMPVPGWAIKVILDTER
ncbi:MAG: VWA-like domain-containing protein [Lachnospiraceae bacterium]|nr:VWA-like domain-containing protein [Lachnospiraceae bacterium]